MFINEEFEKKKTFLLDIAQQIRIVLSEHDIYDANFEKTISGLQDSVLRIGIVGTIKTGKSTTVNALLGKRIVGTDDLPLTASLTEIYHKKLLPTHEAIVYFLHTEDFKLYKFIAEGKTSKIINQDLRMMAEELSSYQRKKLKTQLKIFEQEHIDELQWIDQAPKYINLQEVPQYTTDKACYFVDKVKVYYDLALLENNIAIIDTPGLNDTQIIRSWKTESVMKTFNMVIMVLDAKSGVINSSEKIFIKNLLKRQRLESTFFVINKINQLRDGDFSEEDIDKTVSIVWECLDDIYHELKEEEEDYDKILHYQKILDNAKQHIYTINALGALEAKKVRNQQALSQSRFLQLENALKSYCDNDIYQEYLSNLQYRSKLAFRKLANKFDQQINIRIEKINHIQHNIEKLNEQGMELIEVRDKMIESISDMLEKEEIKLIDKVQDITTKAEAEELFENAADYIQNNLNWAGNFPTDKIGNLEYRLERHYKQSVDRKLFVNP